MTRLKPIVFDDGGFLHANPDGTGFKLTWAIYERLLELAHRCEICIPLACTASFFDLDHQYEQSEPNPCAERIVRFVEEHAAYFEIWNHGLTHTYAGAYTEFYDYRTGAVPAAYQEEHLRLSQAIFRGVGWQPTVFVPPGHAWEPGVTDVLAARYGLEAIAIREFEKTPTRHWLRHPRQRYKKQFPASRTLATEARLGLGIRHDQIDFGLVHALKSRFHTGDSLLGNLAFHRKRRLKYPVTHHFAHVQNMMKPGSMPFFTQIITRLKQQSRTALSLG